MDIRKILRESINKVLNEEYEELSAYDEYANDYPEDSFSKEDISIDELLSFVKNSGDFLYYINGRFHAANSQDIVNEIYDEIDLYGATLSNYLDSDLEWDWEKFFGYDDLYVAVFLVQPSNGTKYYVIYQRDKMNLRYSEM